MQAPWGTLCPAQKCHQPIELTSHGPARQSHQQSRGRRMEGSSFQISSGQSLQARQTARIAVAGTPLQGRLSSDRHLFLFDLNQG